MRQATNKVSKTISALGWLLIPALMAMLVTQALTYKVLRAQGPVTSSPPTIQLNEAEYLAIQNLFLQQENIRLRACMRAGVPADECGDFVPGGQAIRRVVRTAAAPTPTPPAGPPKPADAATAAAAKPGAK